MPRAVAATIALVATGLILAAALAAPRPQQDCSAVPCTYLPLIYGPPPSPTPTATATLTPSTTPTVTNTPATLTPTPEFMGCRTNVPHPEAAPNTPIRIEAVDKIAEKVTLTNVTTDVVDISGWWMCSVSTQWEQGVGGSLAPGQTYTFGPSNQDVWDDTHRDDGVLFNDKGQLVSYWFDR